MHAVFRHLARGMAVAGGIVLTALVLLTCLSVLGRAGNTVLHSDLLEATAPAQWLLDAGVGPVPGDFELVEAGIAFAIFAFLPLCQIAGAHASVDIFTAGLGPRANRGLAALWEVTFAVVLVVIGWRLYDGMLGKMRYNETTFLLQFPVWWAYGASFVAAAVAAVVGIYCAVVRIAELATGRDILKAAGGDA